MDFAKIFYINGYQVLAFYEEGEDDNGNDVFNIVFMTNTRIHKKAIYSFPEPRQAEKLLESDEALNNIGETLVNFGAEHGL